MAALVTSEEVAAILNWPEGADLSELEQPCEAADTIIRSLLSEEKGPHDAHAHDREAASTVAVQIYLSRQAPGGQMQSLDYAPAMVPHLLGPGLTARIQGLIAVCRKYRGATVA